MGLKKTDLTTTEADDSLLGCWYANLLHINRRKCVLFTNEKTLFNFLAPNVNREQIKKLDKLFTESLSCVLAAEKLPEKIQNAIKEECQSIEYAATNNRSTIASMNDIGSQYKHCILRNGDIHIHSAAIPQIIQQLNRMPMGAMDYAYPIDKLKELCE